MAKPTRDFEELLRFFDSRGVRALVVGAHAVAYHAKPRYTKDLDVLVEPTSENARRILDALTDFGFGDLNLMASSFRKHGPDGRKGSTAARKFSSSAARASTACVGGLEQWAGVIWSRMLCQGLHNVSDSGDDAAGS